MRTDNFMKKKMESVDLLNYIRGLVFSCPHNTENLNPEDCILHQTRKYTDIMDRIRVINELSEEDIIQLYNLHLTCKHNHV